MHDLKAYQKLQSMPARDIEETLKEYPFKWNSNARIIDIGSGDGRITTAIWTKYIPQSFMKIIGSDKSQHCVDFAREHYENERIQFIRLDIEEKVPEELKGSFDHAISSYAFHWVNLQEIAFSNVYQMLKEGGSCLLLFLGYFKPYENYRILSRTEKWSAQLKNTETKFMSPYHDSKDPQNEIISMMQRIGFRDVSVKSHYKTYIYRRGVDDFNTLMKCLNPFEGLKDNWDEFMDDYLKLDPDAATSDYQLLIVKGVK